MSEPKTPQDAHLIRWRLVLGQSAAGALDHISGIGSDDLARDAALEWLYQRDGQNDLRGIKKGAPQKGSLDPSKLTVPQWINQVHKLFPQETIERLEKDAVEKFGIHEVVTNKKILERLEPSETLLRAVLLTKHLMNQEVLAMARDLVRKVVEQLVRKLRFEVQKNFSGARTRHITSRKNAKNFDPLRTIARNLKNFDLDVGKLVIREPIFFSRNSRTSSGWQIILVVDQSGSMVSSVIHSAVTAACLWGLPSVRTHLVAFDTEVVDLTNHVTDPVELLMKVQLGGGTDIGRAMTYAAGLVTSPKKAMVVLVTDLYEGADPHILKSVVRSLCAQGTRVLVLGALDDQAAPAFDKEFGRQLSQMGAQVGAMTPLQLVGFLSEMINKG